MKLSLLPFFSFLFYFFLHATLALAVIETDRFQLIHENLIQDIKKMPTNELLFVLDIDNTLLSMNQDFGSDQWFEWQSQLLMHSPQHEMLVAPSFIGLLRIQGILFYISQMNPPEKEIPAFIQEIQNKGVATIVLTSRGYDFRDATERELYSNNYDFSQSAIGPQGGFSSRYRPYQAELLNDYGLSQSEAQKWNLPAKPSFVSYQDGIFMTAGQHKGAMLRTLLTKTKQSFSKIVFVDDHLKHCTRVEDAFKTSSTEIVSYYYTATLERVERFKNSDKQKEHAQWLELKEILEKY